MKLQRLLFATLASVLLLACHKEEVEISNGVGAQKMKQVTISTSMDSPSTRASLDSETGAFSWQSGDLISVLATDGNFYDFILESGVGNYEAEFVGSIPENAYVTTVATYPRIVSNGSANTVLVGSTLNYNLPATWTYAKDVSNVPMVAAFSENATHMAFKQVGGVMRFPVKNMPTEAKFIITMEDKTITGAFPVDINNLGTSAMTAGSSASELVINYSSEIDGAYAEFNVPVPTGTYNNFTLTIKDANDKVLFTKEYTSDINKVERATLLNMKEITLPERPMTIAEVWPFFVDARVVFNKVEGVTDYAFYVDGAETPVIVEAEDLKSKLGEFTKEGVGFGALIGGDFQHNTTHSVAVAKVIDGQVVADSKSEAVEFTTAGIRQLTRNTGTKFISVGWDDVAVNDYEVPTWDSVKERYSVALDCGDNKRDRGYRVQLLAADKTTVIYDMVPFNGHCDFEVAFANTTMVAKTNGGWITLPTALTFGWLEPGKDYYFRVKTLDEPVMMDITNGNYNPAPSDSKPVPSPIYSARGGSAWSELVKVSTDAAHVASSTEILYEGFDDMLVNQDFMNWSVAVIPDVCKERTPISKADYQALLKTGYPEFLNTPASERKWTTEGWHQGTLSAEKYGMFVKPWVANEYIELNEVAGSLKGWAVSSAKSNTVLAPQYGSVRLVRALAKYAEVAKLRTPAINSDKLLEDVGTKCIVTAQVSFLANGLNASDIARLVDIEHLRGDNLVKTSTYNIQEMYPEKWNDEYLGGGETTSDYAHYNTYYEIKSEVYLRKGDYIAIAKNTAGKGGFIVGEIKIEIVPGEYENDITNPNDTGIGTEPDDTNYDVYGLGEFPISYWYTVEPWSYTNADGSYNDELTKARYQEMKDSGINIAMYYGHAINRSITEQKRLLGILEQIGMKFIGSASGAHVEIPTAEQIAEIKEHLAPSSAYLGDLVRDEPGAHEFDGLGAYVDEFHRQMPDKDVYINLFPDYANPVTQLKSANYEEHIDQYIEKVDTKALSYDYYGLNANGGVTNTYYTNLDLVRSKTLAVRKPYWVITQAGAVGSCRMPNEVEQRWSVWSTIAGGSKGISYFCYWTPSGGAIDASPYMIDLDGNKTDMYYYVQRINADINTIGKKLLPCHADGLITSTTIYFPLFDNSGAGRTKYGPVQKVSAVSEHVAVGCFRDARRSENGDNYKGYKVLVTPHMPNKDIQTRLTLDSSVTTITVTQNNTSKVVDLNNLSNVNVIDGEKGINLSYADGKLTLNIPQGEALLIEF